MDRTKRVTIERRVADIFSSTKIFDTKLNWKHYGVVLLSSLYLIGLILTWIFVSPVIPIVAVSLALVLNVVFFITLDYGEYYTFSIKEILYYYMADANNKFVYNDSEELYSDPSLRTRINLVIYLQIIFALIPMIGFDKHHSLFFGIEIKTPREIVGELVENFTEFNVQLHWNLEQKVKKQEIIFTRNNPFEKEMYPIDLDEYVRVIDKEKAETELTIYEQAVEELREDLHTLHCWVEEKEKDDEEEPLVKGVF